MDRWWLALLLAWGAGLAMVAAGLLARWERIRPQWLEQEFRHAVIAFGGGALLAAVALVLVPEGVRELAPLAVCVCLSAGGLAFMLLDVQLAAHKSSASQLVAMLADYLPEALALGAVFAHGKSTASLLALLIAIQNFPEGFNAYRELTQLSGFSSKRVLWTLLFASLLGPLAAAIGLFALASQPSIVGGVMLFAAGGILYLTFQDIAPQARLQRHWGPPLGAVAGFLLGVLGEMLIP